MKHLTDEIRTLKMNQICTVTVMMQMVLPTRFEKCWTRYLVIVSKEDNVLILIENMVHTHNVIGMVRR